MTLAEYIEKRKLTLEEFGKQIGMSRSATHRIARGQAYPMPETAKRIVEVTKGAVKLKDLYA
jgi:transcriptional regulator with XRE-family HTH domain